MLEEDPGLAVSIACDKNVQPPTHRYVLILYGFKCVGRQQAYYKWPFKEQDEVLKTEFPLDSIGVGISSSGPYHTFLWIHM
jgi:hypothetical protein